MARSQLRSKTSPQGGKIRASRKKKKYELEGISALTKLAKEKLLKVRTMGGSVKMKVLAQEVANVYDPKAKKSTKSKIKSVLNNPASRHFARRNIITKGAEIETEAGKARVTSRPGQHGTINAVLIK
jgi:small subunit ribosomal protein S8e|tara:strand:+ start:2533 stop:2913 length:381 start_codon:yes stop_codon:yes gene_type:complete